MPPPEVTIRRIVVAMDNTATAGHALDAAIDLAARLQAELEGLFVEDETLMRVAELNLGRTFNMLSGRAQTFDAAAMSAMLRGEAARVREALAAQAARSRVSHTFRVVRGLMAHELITAAEAADLLVLSLAGRQVGAGMRAAPAALAAIERARAPVLIVRPGTQLRGRAFVLYDSPDDGADLLSAAARLIAGADGSLVVLLVGTDDAAVAERRARAEADLARLGLAAGFRRVQTLALDDVCSLLGGADAGVLVVSARHPLIAGESRASLLERVACPVLVVR